MTVAMWNVFERRALKKGERKVRVLRYMVLATSAQGAIDLIMKEEIDELRHTHKDSKWSARQVEEPFVSMGLCYADPTEEEKKSAR